MSSGVEYPKNTHSFILCISYCNGLQPKHTQSDTFGSWLRKATAYSRNASNMSDGHIGNHGNSNENIQFSPRSGHPSDITSLSVYSPHDATSISLFFLGPNPVVVYIFGIPIHLLPLVCYADSMIEAYLWCY